MRRARPHGTQPVRDTSATETVFRQPTVQQPRALLECRGGGGPPRTDVGGIDWADGLVAIVDGPDPDSGTSWEVGYAFRKKPIVMVRTDFRAFAGRSGDYSPMLTEAATIRLDLPNSTPAEVAATIIAALGRLETT